MRQVKRVNYEKAVSPVIATILMVAITVVLSGVLYVWAANLAESNTDGTFEMYTFSATSAPGELTSDSNDNLIIVTMDQGQEINWAKLSVKLSIAGAASVSCAGPGETTGPCIVLESEPNGGVWYSKNVPTGYGVSHITYLNKTFENILKKKFEPPVDAYEAYLTSLFVHSLYKSSETSKWIKVNSNSLSKKLGNKN